MAELFMITPITFPKKYQDIYEGFTIRPISIVEQTLIEDWIFNKNLSLQLPTGSFTVILPNVSSAQTLNDEYAIIVEFALSFFITSGFIPVIASALLSDGRCIRVSPHRIASPTATNPDFSKSMKGAAVPQWIRRCFLAYSSDKKRIQITAFRYLRYLLSRDTFEGLLDLCISLESLIDAQSEVSFRFATCLAKVTGAKGQNGEDSSSILNQLYDLRSRLVHGDPDALKKLRVVEQSRGELDNLARKILVTYILFLSNHNRKEWNSHVRSVLFE